MKVCLEIFRLKHHTDYRELKNEPEEKAKFCSTLGYRPG